MICEIQERIPYAVPPSSKNVFVFTQTTRNLFFPLIIFNRKRGVKMAKSKKKKKTPSKVSNSNGPNKKTTVKESPKTKDKKIQTTKTAATKKLQNAPKATAKKRSRHGCAITKNQTLFSIGMIIIIVLGISASILNIAVAIIFDDSTASFTPTLIILPSLILLISLQASERRYMIAKKSTKRNKLRRKLKGEIHNMLELAKQLIDQECKIISVGIAPVKGVIKEVSDGAIKVETKYGDYVFNADFVMAIEKKNK